MTIVKPKLAAEGRESERIASQRCIKTRREDATKVRIASRHDVDSTSNSKVAHARGREKKRKMGRGPFVI